MSGHPSTGEDGAEDDEEGVEETERTKIDVRIGNLSISVENHDREACEEQFYRIYDFCCVESL